jgi:endogenous inhibitor of DNA gyrase (YacG/DUF329 family)
MSDDDIAPGGSYRYFYRYAMSPAFTTFFGLDPNKADHRYNTHQLHRIIINYAKMHNGIKDHAFHYDEALWNLFSIDASARFKLRDLDDKIALQRNLVRPCPICEKPRPFKMYQPNEVCMACIPASLLKPPLVKDPTFLTMVLSDMAVKENPSENTVILQGVTCKRRYQNENVFDAIVHCPLCQAEVDEERRLDAFCDYCAKLEELVDANGNRVRFKCRTSYYDHEDLMYWDDKEDGFAVLHYENGEIIRRIHEGPFTCFFRGVECVAEDTGAHDRIIVRFRTKQTRKWEHIRLPPFRVLHDV